jgi:hypothetical protein
VPGQILAGSVVMHRGARVGVTAAIWTSRRSTPASKGRDERIAEHMRMRPGDLDAGGLCGSMQAASGCVAVHPFAAAVWPRRL